MRSILGRYDKSGDDGDKPHGEAAPGVTLVHIRAVEVLDQLMMMSTTASGESTPPQVRALVGTLRRLRPMMIENFSKVPPATIVAFMTKLRDDVQGVIDAGTEPTPAGGSNGDDTPAGDVEPS